jgi:hypothetical protein
MMIPIRPHGRLYGLLEMGRRAPFLASETAYACALVDALVNRIEAGGLA